MKKVVILLGFSAIALAGCTGGTTYGTGSSHEVATVKSLGKIFSLKNESSKIDYKTRPELVLPANRNALPQPVDNRALATDQDWPESPELRSAKLSGSVPTADKRSRGGADLPIEFLTDTNKAGIGNSARIQRSARKNTNSGGDEFIQAIKDDANGTGSGKLARERRDQLAFSTGVQRKFLTEPPVEYRTPSVNAEAGDLGISEEVLTARQKRLEKDRVDSTNGVLTPQGADF